MIARASFGALAWEWVGSEISDCAESLPGSMMKGTRAGVWGNSYDAVPEGLSSTITSCGEVESFSEGQTYWRCPVPGHDARLQFSPPAADLDRSAPPAHRLRPVNFVLTSSRLFTVFALLSTQASEFLCSLMQLACAAEFGGADAMELSGDCGCESKCCCRQGAGPDVDTLCLAAPVVKAESELMSSTYGQIYNSKMIQFQIIVHKTLH